MIIRIWWGKVYPQWPSIEETYQRLNAVKVPGMLGRIVTRDVNDAESMYTITVWDEIESVRAWEESGAYREFLDAVGRFAAGSQSVSLCEVKAMNVDGLLASLQSDAGSGPAPAAARPDPKPR